MTGLDFDLQGNLASREPAGAAAQGYRFDFGNRLREVDGVERYRYDGHGRRVLAMQFVQGIVLSQYGLDGKLLYQKSDRTLLQTDHVYLGNTLVAIHERPASGTGPEPVKYQHTDGLGSPVVVTRQDRSRAEESEYEPYGQVINRPPRDGPGYTGHVEDAATGFVYMQQRYYDPQLGVFLSTDPVTAYSSPISQFHRYRYANNNPYSLIDPDGRRASGDDQKTTGSLLRGSEVARGMISNVANPGGHETSRNPSSHPNIAQAVGIAKDYLRTETPEGYEFLNDIEGGIDNKMFDYVVGKTRDPKAWAEFNRDGTGIVISPRVESLGYAFALFQYLHEVLHPNPAFMALWDKLEKSPNFDPHFNEVHSQMQPLIRNAHQKATRKYPQL